MKDNSQKLLYKAEFHPLLRQYLFLYVLFLLLATVVGIPLIPFLLLGFGFYAVNRYFKCLECKLFDRTLEFRKGYLFRMEKTIPLDKIQDLTLREGPLLRALGLTRLDVETAGRSGAENGAEAKLVGIIDAREFRDMVLKQRDELVDGLKEKSFSSEDNKQVTEDTIQLLTEIRDLLKKITDKI